MPVRDTAIELHADLRAFIGIVDSKMEELVKAVIFALFRKIVLRTPIDKGRAAGSWGVSRGGSGVEMIPPDQGGSPSIALAKLGTVSFSGPYDIWWIYNNLPYIEVLEFGLYGPNSPSGKTSAGFSIQAPAGMVRVAVAEIEGEWESIVAMVAGSGTMGPAGGVFGSGIFMGGE